MKKTFFKIFIVLFPVFDDYFKFVSINMAIVAENY